MSYYKISEDEVQEIKKRLDDISFDLKNKQRTEPDQIWYDNQEFLQLMNISKRTAQTWRDESIISFSQVGSKIYYRMSDVQKLLDSNYTQAYKKRK